jgi:hypothetical protein
VVLLAKSEVHAIHVWHAVENLVYQRAGRRKNDFASSLHEESSPPRMKIAQAIFTSVAHAPRRTKRHENSRAIFNGVSKVTKSQDVLTWFVHGSLSKLSKSPY